jgi:hypothetical protein
MAYWIIPTYAAAPALNGSTLAYMLPKRTHAFDVTMSAL